ncbi:hypothetical protein [Mammaliicoccus sciuri]|uniref:hypothetical protein n=1 Tax=Mammaliicoccus sciuri TaxID=1296 RepID=UPI002B260E4A|nr:hypothetical protein [Mammaliicoccus sciuri]WQK75231.1 hypothetical protein P3U33_05735 [Mammaliicoccus sciuri]
MWEIYTLYMINEEEKVAVKYYSDRETGWLEKEAQDLLEDTSFDRYEILGLLGMYGKKEQEVLNGYKILAEYEYAETQTSIRGKKLELIK